jgi:hypothetical protein
MDLYDPLRPLSSLSPYEHLHRILRMCTIHVCRRIKALSVPEEVKTLMRSLICITHENWDYTLSQITLLGGKAAVGTQILQSFYPLTHIRLDWVNDKFSSHFIFQGICWEKSCIPLPVWQAGERHSNLIETVHRDVNREGVHCTLLGGIIRGQRFDALKMKTLLVSRFSLARCMH